MVFCAPTERPGGGAAGDKTPRVEHVDEAAADKEALGVAGVEGKATSVVASIHDDPDQGKVGSSGEVPDTGTGRPCRRGDGDRSADSTRLQEDRTVKSGSLPEKG